MRNLSSIIDTCDMLNPQNGSLGGFIVRANDLKLKLKVSDFTLIGVHFRIRLTLEKVRDKQVLVDG